MGIYCLFRGALQRKNTIKSIAYRPLSLYSRYIARKDRVNINAASRKVKMRYRAIVGIKKSSLTNGLGKAKREAIEVELMKELLKYWDASQKVTPYYHPHYDTDKRYMDILKRNQKSLLPDDIKIDDPEAVMNYVGRQDNMIFYTSVPDFDAKNRSLKKKEYEKKSNEYKRKHKKVPEELKEEYKHDLIEPKMAKKTKLYAYSTSNPNGMFHSYSYPIENSYIESIDDVSASKLLNRNYGTMHDIILMGDLDFEGTFFPNVVFRNDGEVLESYPDYDMEKEADPGGDPEEIRKFLEETMDREDYIAIIECEL